MTPSNYSSNGFRLPSRYTPCFTFALWEAVLRINSIMSEYQLAHVFGTTERIESLLDSKIGQRFEVLDQRGMIAAEYVWIGGTGADLRSKTKTLDKKPSKVEDLPVWNFDGSSTGQAPGNDSEVFLVPR